MPALIEWIDALGHEEADKVTEGRPVHFILECAQQKLDPRFLIPGLSQLTRQAVLHTLTDTITLYLDSQQTWLDLAQRGLHTLLVHVATSMWVSVQQYREQAADPIMRRDGVTPYFLFLSDAGDFYFTHSSASLQQSFGDAAIT